MALKPEDLNDMVDAAVVRAIEQFKKSQPSSCALEIDKKEHSAEHEFVRELMNVACKLEKIKWGFLGTVVKTVGGILVVAVVIGLLVLAKQRMTGIVP